MSIIAAPFNLKDLMKRIANITDVNSLPDNGMTDISGIFVTNAFFKELDKINLKDIIQKIKSPILVLHGTKDELIDTKSANELFEGLKTEKKLVFIEGGDHTLIREEDINCIRANVIQWIQDH
jgi:putative redox protein